MFQRVTSVGTGLGKLWCVYTVEDCSAFPEGIAAICDSKDELGNMLLSENRHRKKIDLPYMWNFCS